MKIFKDIMNGKYFTIPTDICLICWSLLGDEMLADSFPIQLVDDVAYEVQTKVF